MENVENENTAQCWPNIRIKISLVLYQHWQPISAILIKLTYAETIFKAKLWNYFAISGPI